MDMPAQDEGTFFEATVFLDYFKDLPDSRVIGAQPRARRWRVLRTPAVKRATETTVLAPIRQGAGEL